MPEEWVSDLKRLHDEQLDRNWHAHLKDLNRRYGFVGDHALSTACEGAAPAWFNGDVEAVGADPWVLVISLNPAKPPEGHYRGDLTPETAWDFWRLHNTDYWYTDFFRPLVRLTTVAFDEPIIRDGWEERYFATNRMIFIELCPYASKKFDISASSLLELQETDVGFRCAQHVRRILLDQARPSLVLVNGEATVKDFEVVENDRLIWTRRDYGSKSRVTKKGTPKPLWHCEGWYRSGERSIPIAGFKFLRRQANHNTYAEIDQLGMALRSLNQATRPT